MKKYPVIYKNKEYEVRWEKDILCGFYIEIYEVKHFGKIKYYKRRYTQHEIVVNKFLHISKNASNYYIEQAKVLFELWETEIQENEAEKAAEIKKQKALAEWEGVIEG
jgi:hypothetical protein